LALILAVASSKDRIPRMTDFQDACPKISATALGDYVRFDSCQRRFRFRHETRDEKKAAPAFEAQLSTPIDPILQEAGDLAEKDWEAMLLAAGVARIPIAKEAEFDHLRPHLARLTTGQNAFAREIKVAGAIGTFFVDGRMDFVIVLWRGGRPRLRIVETKASRRDKTYHRIQIATYKLILDRKCTEGQIIVGGFKLGPADIDYSVGRYDETTNALQDLLATKTLDLDMETQDILQKMRGGGELAEIIATEDTSTLPYCLDDKCDDCEFDVRCMTQSARDRRMELVGLPPATINLFKENGIDDIDALAQLDLDSASAMRLRQSEGLRVDLLQTTEKAKARRATLPRGDGDPDNFQVRPLKHTPIGQLPVHFEEKKPALVRIYVEVSYDYVENRIAALAAHVTDSPLVLSTTFSQADASTKRTPVYGINEVEPKKAQSNAPLPAHKRDIFDIEFGAPAADAPSVAAGVASPTIIKFKREPWEKNYKNDTRAEAAIIEDFFRDTILAISAVARSDRATIHFYFYSRNEITRLIEACTRCGDDHLKALADLLGCRQNSEQMIFSCIQNEITSRFALGWTSQSLGVAASLNWYGQSYHWARTVQGENVDLDRLFERDIFDFKTSLPYDAASRAWLEDDQPADFKRTRFEIRSRNADTLKAPYLRATWKTLPTIGAIEAGMKDISEGDPDRAFKLAGRKASLQKVEKDLKAYSDAGRPEIIEAYLAARVHALRWLEERIQYKNTGIDKVPLDLSSLWTFDLPENSTFNSARTFLRVDQTVKKDDWLAEHLVPPSIRVQSGDTLPIREISVADNGSLTAKMDLGPHGIAPSDFARRSSIGEGAFVRLSERQGSPYTGQTQRMLEKSGSTCRVSSVDWNTGAVGLTPIPNLSPNLYQPVSRIWKAKEGPHFALGTLDSSISDFVAGHVENRLLSGKGRHVGSWLDSENPSIPPITGVADPFAEVAIANWVLPGTGHTLSRDQASAVRDGLESRVQLIKGPPGTGKTATTSAAILIRAATMHVLGDVILVSANTHRAVDTLLERLSDYRENFLRFAARNGGPTSMKLNIGRVHGRGDTRDVPRGAERIVSESPSKKVAAMRASGITVIAGTTAGILKFAQSLDATSAYSEEPFAAHSLIVDEASMLVFPHFLALASLVREDGTIVLAGDDLQLSPIISNDWDKEDRPPTKHYQPFLSAYESVMGLARRGGLPRTALRESALTMTFRLPSDVRRLIEDTYRKHDHIQLESRADPVPTTTAISHLSEILRCDLSVLAVVHGENGSRNYNPFEAELLRQMIGTGAGLADKSVAIITPHRAQRAFLTDLFGTQPSIAGAIDTVERFQGGEQDTVIVTGTESDPYAIGAAADFILNLNRANVAFSRAKRKLVVVVAQSLLDHVPPELESYKSAVLWKALRSLCRHELMPGDLKGHQFRVLTMDPAGAPQP
jgi:hypothetical protein